MRARLEFTLKRLEAQVVSAHKTSLLEFKVALLGRVHVVEDDKAARRLVFVKLTKVNGLHGKSNLRAICVFGVEVSAAKRKVFVELGYIGLLLARMEALAAQPHDSRLLLLPLNVFNADGQVKFVSLRLKRLEHGVDVLCFASLQLSVRVLDVEDSEIVVQFV